MRAEKIEVKPGTTAAGEPLRVLDLNGNPIPAAGRKVPRSTFYTRLLAAGDLVLVKAAPDTKPATTSKRNLNQQPEE